MYWLQQTVVSAAIIAAILLLSLVPARQVLLPLWPGHVEELVVLEEGRRSAARALVMGNSELEPARVLVQSRPLSAAVIETGQGASVLGYPVGIRSEDGQQLSSDRPLPAAFSASVIRSMPQIDGALMIMNANDQLQSIPLRQIRRVYYPNRLSLPERAWFVLRRVQSAWLDPARPEEQALVESE